MKLSTKIILAATISVVATALGAAITIYWLSAHNRVNALHHSMTVVLRQAEIVADQMDKMHIDKAFDLAGLKDKAKQESDGQPLTESYRKTSLFNVIPIVASWQAAEKAAKNEGYEFYSPIKPGLTARNPKNNPGTEYDDAFAAFAAGEQEFFKHDKANNKLILVRPVKIAKSCLSCHGEPATSASGDGKDILGFNMENLKLGDTIGAFVLKAPFTNDAVIRNTMRSMTLVTLILLVIIVTGFYFFSKYYVNKPLTLAIRRIDATSQQTNASAREISSTSQMLAEGASEQAASIEETSASVEEITSMSRRNGEAALQAEKLMNETKGAAETGASQVGQMRQATEEIRQSSENIARIMKTIDEIAFQTNILALNAAVEAARAGSAGAGFAVVADEVRALAQRSAAAAKETAQLIEDAITRSRRGVVISGSLDTAFAEITGRVRSVNDLVKEIRKATEEQISGIGQIGTAMTQLDQVTQQNAAAAEEGAASAQELAAQAHTMQEAVQHIEHLVGTDGGAAPVEAASAKRVQTVATPLKATPVNKQIKPALTMPITRQLSRPAPAIQDKPPGKDEPLSFR